MKPAYRVIVALRCPCEACGGELLDSAQVEEVSDLREACRLLEGPSVHAHECYELSAMPAGPGSWLSRTGVVWDGGCRGEDACAEYSLHLPTGITEASAARIFRWLQARYRI